MSALQDCFDHTDWDLFKEAPTINQHINVEEYAASVSAYIQKCTEDVGVTKNIIIRANQKHWMIGKVRAMLNTRNAAFNAGDMVVLRTARANLNRAIRAGDKDCDRLQGCSSTLCGQHIFS